MSPWRTRTDLPRLGALALFAAALWLGATGKWTAQDWATPASYSVDALETLARFQVSAEQGTTLFTSPGAARLGAPAAADWTSYPLPDFAWYWVAGRAVNALGLVPASNLMLLLAHVLAVVSFFFCARWLGHRPLFAAVAALLFGFSFSLWHRGLSHHSFALAFAVPPALLVVWLVARARGMLRRRATWAFGLVSAALVGSGSPYFIYGFGLMLGLAWCWQLLRERRRANLLFGVAVGLACLGVFVATDLPFLRTGAAAGGALARGAGEAEIYGLHWIDLVTPPPNHRLPVLAAWGQAHAARAQGEPFAPYLGVVGVAGLLALALGAGRRPRRLVRPAYALWATWLLAFALAGGLNTWLARAGLDSFRASNRYSIHLLAIVLFFLASRASRASRRGPRVLAWVAAVAVGAVGWWDQTPRGPGPEHEAQLREAAAADRAFGQRLEAALPPGGAVFQLPVARFPEQGPIHRMGDYEHLRLFLGTRTLRFSYGLMGDDPLLAWQRNLAALPAAELVAELQAAGFAAVVVQRAGFPDGGQSLQSHLIAAGATPLSDDADRFAFRLRPHGPLRPPAAEDPRRFARWDESPPRRHEPAVLLGRGWHAPERSASDLWRWAGQRATLHLFNPGPDTLALRLRARVTTNSATTLTFRTVARTHIEKMPAYTAREIELSLIVPPGLTELAIESEARARRGGSGDPRRLAFNLAALRAEFSPTPAR